MNPPNSILDAKSIVSELDSKLIVLLQPTTFFVEVVSLAFVTKGIIVNIIK